MAADRSSTGVFGPAFGGGRAVVRMGGAPLQPFDKKPTPGNDRNWVKCISATAMEGRP
jgi:hypothetical protein